MLSVSRVVDCTWCLFTRTCSCGWCSDGVGLGGRKCSSDGALGSMVEGLEANTLLKRSVSRVFTVIMYATEGPLGILATEFSRLTSLQ